MASFLNGVLCDDEMACIDDMLVCALRDQNK